MVTKSKKYNSGLYGIFWLCLIAATVACGILVSITASMWNAQRWSAGYYGYYDENNNWIVYDDTVYAGKIAPGIGDFITATGIGAVACGAAAIILLVLVSMWTGRGNLQEDGTIRLSWFDRVWSELHLAAMFGFGAAFAFLVVVPYDLWVAEDWFGVFRSDLQDANYFGIPNDLSLVLIVSAMVASAILCLTSAVSMVKKLKAHRFWENSLIGGIWLWIYRGIRGSDRTTVKVVLFLLLLCALSATWVGLIAALLLILLVVPSQVRQYKAVRQGVTQVCSGNLNYKIPVSPGRSGTIGEFGRLASDINRISQAQKIAVENELKNQRMKTELISNVSHDLKTPLTSMSAYIDLLKQEGLDSPNAPEYLEILDRKTQRLKALTENLFEAAKASSGAIPVSLGEIDLPALVTQSTAEMEERLAGRGLKVIVRNQCENAGVAGSTVVGSTAGSAASAGSTGNMGNAGGIGSAGSSCKVIADGQLLWRVIENLLGNVCKYALEGSRVYINISRLQSRRAGYPSKIILEIKNISAEQLNISAEELMERFKRGDESRNTEGSGLGLAIARDLVHLMKGTLELTIDGDLFKACVVLDEAGDLPDSGTEEAAAQEQCEDESGGEGATGEGIAVKGKEIKRWFSKHAEMFSK